MATQKKTPTTTPATPPAASPPPASPPAAQPPQAATSATPTMTGVVANGSNKGTKVELEASYLALIAGLLANFQPDDPFAVRTGTMTRDEVVAELQGYVTSAENTKASNQAWRADVQAERASEQKVAPLRADLKGILVAQLGRSSPQLLGYGFTPAKLVVVTPAARAAGVAKGKATREARGTKGKAQKLLVTGNVTGVVITPVIAGPSVPAMPAPAASVANASNGAGAPAASPTPPSATGGTPQHS
jgi:uncharacterized protein YbcI